MGNQNVIYNEVLNEIYNEGENVNYFFYVNIDHFCLKGEEDRNEIENGDISFKFLLM